MGKLFILSAPSGAGKTSVARNVIQLIGDAHNIKRVITYTSRKPRSGESSGIDYCFISEDEFKKRIDQNFFLEYSTAYQSYYGTPRSILYDMANGKSFLLIVDHIGAGKVYKKVDATLIWLYTSNIDILRKRLLNRATENSKEIIGRLQQAQKEIEQEKKVKLFHHHIENNDIKNTVNAVLKIIVEQIVKKS